MKCLLILILLLYPSLLLPQSRLSGVRADRERGIPYIQTYTPKKYNAGPDNWSAVQNKAGIMYFGNKNGVLEYDGVSWRLIQLPNLGVVRSLDIDNSNKIYVGGYNEIGFLAPDSVGQLRYVSLKDKLDPALQDFQNVWRTLIYHSDVYFQTSKYLMRWKNNEFKVWQANTEFGISKIIHDSLFIFEVNTGLKKLTGDTLQLVFDSAKLQNKRIIDIAAYQDDHLLALTVRNGLLLFKKRRLKPFQSPANKYLEKQWGYRLTLLPNGWYSVGTIRGGIAVIDETGKVVQILTKAQGLADNSIYYQYIDRQNGLWLATREGISRVELPSPYTIFDERTGIDGFVNMIHRHQGSLYVANDQGILRLKKTDSPTAKNRFTLFKNTDQGFDLLSAGASLFAAANSGLYEIVDGKIRNTFAYSGGSLFKSRFDTSRLFIGLFDGLASLKKVDGKWIDDGRIKGIKDNIRKIVEDKKGNLWLESQVDGVWRVDFSSDTSDFHNPSVKHFKANRELPKGVLFLNSIRGEPVFEISGYVYRYDAERDSITVDVTFGERFGLTGKIAPKREDKYGNVWMYAQVDTTIEKKPRVVAILKEGGIYSLKKIGDERISQNVRKVLYPEDDGIVWYGGTDGIIRHDTKDELNTDPDFKPLIRRVTANSDSLIFGGAAGGERDISLPFASNNLRFEFAAPSYDGVSANQFQFWLEGFDENWSPWTSETQKDYTNIPGGSYTFRVRAKNVYGTESLEAAFLFEVLPPFYRTWWAYCIYGLFFMGFVAGIVKWRSRKLQLEKETLEELVAKKTRQVKEQAEQLKALDEAKSRFFANISHEFRTPLALILGQVQQLESGSASENPRPLYRMIRRNGNRVLALVNQLLDLSTLESGKMKLQAQKTDLVSFLKPIVAAYNSLGESKRIKFSFNYPDENILVYLDMDKIENVVNNVLSNAFKFTGANGEIVITVAKNEMEDTGSARIEIEDTGRGIPSDQLEKIFDRFYQADDSRAKRAEGSGIGLALAKELLMLHRGSITVESTVGEGSRFTISLPLGKGHLTSDEIIDNLSSTIPDKDEAVLPAENIAYQPEAASITNDKIAEEGMDLENSPRYFSGRR